MDAFLGTRVRYRLAAVGLLALAAWLLVPGTSPARAVTDTTCYVDANLVNSCRPWFGGSAKDYPQVANDKLTQLQYYETRTGRPMDIAHTYHGVSDSSLNAGDLYFAQRDDTYLFTNWKVADVWADADGSDDAVNARIDAMAASIKSLGDKKIFLTLSHEPENDLTGDPNCPSLNYVGSAGTPADYRAMWANVEKRFDAAGVTNVVWAMDFMNYPTWNCVEQDVYPGDDLIDWIVFNAYQTGDTDLSFDNRVDNLYAILAANSTSEHDYLSKPWGLVEWGIRDSTQASAYQYYAQAREALDADTFPKLKMYLAFDEDDQATGNGSYRVAYDVAGNYDPAEQAAYNEFANDPRLTGDWVYIGDDNTPPEVSITAPIADQTVSGAVSVVGTASDDTLLGATSLLVDGATVATSSGAAPTFGWDTTSVADGAHVLQLRSTDQAGNVGTSATVSVNVHNVVPDTTAPTAPTGLTATLSGVSVKLSWTASKDAGGLAGYTVYRNGAAIGSSTTTRYTDNGAPQGKAATYQVVAQDLANNVSGASNSVTVKVPDRTAPTAPTALHATGGARRVTLTWSAATDNVAVKGYYLYRGATRIASLGASALSYADTGLKAKTRYTYSLIAYDAAGNKSPAASATATTS